MRMIRFVLFGVVLLLIACGRNGDEKKTSILVIDDLGRALSIPKSPHRVISLAPSVTELLFMIGADSLLIARTQNCDYPKEVKRLPVIVNYPYLDKEKLIQLKPDLVITYKGMTSQDDATILQNLNVPTYYLSFSTLEDWASGVKELSKLLHTNFDTLKFDQRFPVTLEKEPAKKVVALCGVEPLYAFGKETIINDLIKKAGGINAITQDFEDSFPMLNREYLLATDPDLLITTFNPPNQLFNLYPSLKRMKVYQTNQIYAVDTDLMSRPGSRVLECFKKLSNIIEN